MTCPVVRVFDSASQISECQWSQLTTNPYESHAWFRANEDYFADTRFLFFCACEGARLRAILPVYDTHSPVYPGSADLLSKRAASLLKRMSFLICGSPLSFVSDVIGDPAMDGILANGLRRYACEHGIDLISFPFARRPLPLNGVATRRSLTDYELDLTGKCLDDYLASFRRKKRKELKRELRRTRLCVREPLEGHEELVAHMREVSAARHGSKAVISAQFYEIVARHMGGTVRTLLAGREGDWRGAVCYFVSGKTLYLFHGGVLGRDFTYFNLTFYEPIRIACELGLTSINYRPGCAKMKLLRGCRGISTMLHCAAVSVRARALLAVMETARRVRALRLAAVPGRASRTTAK